MITTIYLYLLIGIVLLVGGALALSRVDGFDFYVSDDMPPGLLIVAICLIVSGIICWPLIMIAIVTILISASR